MKRIITFIAVITASLVLTGCNDGEGFLGPRPMGDINAANWQCKHRGGIKNTDARGRSVVCEDGTAHSTRLFVKKNGDIINAMENPISNKKEAK